MSVAAKKMTPITKPVLLNAPSPANLARRVVRSGIDRPVATTVGPFNSHIPVSIALACALRLIVVAPFAWHTHRLIRWISNAPGHVMQVTLSIASRIGFLQLHS
jgi:hypothetical protein